MTGTLGALAPRLATAFVTLDQRPAQDRLEWGQLTHESLTASSQGGSRLVLLHMYQTTYMTGLILQGGKYIFQPFCLGLISRSRRVANSKSESASSRRGGKPSEPYGDGSAQSVHSRAMLKLPRSNSRSRRVSIPAIRRAFKTWKRWPRSGWNGWRISAHPKGELHSCAVRAGRGDAQRP
jgi:hypothetical protein